MKPMRDEYELSRGQPNPYAERLGSEGRAKLVRWWSSTTANLRVLPDDLARELPDTETTVSALRLVVKLRKAKRNGKPARARRPAPRRGRG
jgi:hypothetical protein